MSKQEILNKILETGFVAIIRTENADKAIKISEACFEGGVKALEVTFTVPKAEDAISFLSNKYKDSDILVGAGTVLNAETAILAIDSGAKFIVSPYLSEAVAKVCIERDIPYMPGAMTLTEAVKCMEAGGDIVKIFPGELYGPAIIKAFKGPLPNLKLMPTGGVSLDNIHEWIQAGAVAVGVGGNLTAGAKTGDYDLISKIASQYIEKIKEARLLYV